MMLSTPVAVAQLALPQSHSNIPPLSLRALLLSSSSSPSNAPSVIVSLLPTDSVASLKSRLLKALVASNISKTIPPDVSLSVYLNLAALRQNIGLPDNPYNNPSHDPNFSLTSHYCADIPLSMPYVQSADRSTYPNHPLKRKRLVSPFDDAFLTFDIAPKRPRVELPIEVAHALVAFNYPTNGQDPVMELSEPLRSIIDYLSSTGLISSISDPAIATINHLAADPHNPLLFILVDPASKPFQHHPSFATAKMMGYSSFGVAKKPQPPRLSIHRLANPAPVTLASQASLVPIPPEHKQPQQGPHVCEWRTPSGQCGMAFPSLVPLYTHLINDHIGAGGRRKKNAPPGTNAREEDGLFHCSWSACSVSVKKRDHIITHLRVHVPVKPFMCEVCGKSYKHAQDLKKHERGNHPEHFTQQEHQHRHLQQKLREWHSVGSSSGISVHSSVAPEAVIKVASPTQIPETIYAATTVYSYPIDHSSDDIPAAVPVAPLLPELTLPSASNEAIRRREERVRAETAVLAGATSLVAPHAAPNPFSNSVLAMLARPLGLHRVIVPTVPSEPLPPELAAVELCNMSVGDLVDVDMWLDDRVCVATHLSTKAHGVMRTEFLVPASVSGSVGTMLAVATELSHGLPETRTDFQDDMMIDKMKKVDKMLKNDFMMVDDPKPMMGFHPSKALGGFDGMDFAILQSMITDSFQDAQGMGIASTSSTPPMTMMAPTTQYDQFEPFSSMVAQSAPVNDLWAAIPYAAPVEAIAPSTRKKKKAGPVSESEALSALASFAASAVEGEATAATLRLNEDIVEALKVIKPHAVVPAPETPASSIDGSRPPSSVSYAGSTLSVEQPNKSYITPLAPSVKPKFIPTLAAPVVPQARVASTSAPAPIGAIPADFTFLAHPTSLQDMYAPLPAPTPQIIFTTTALAAPTQPATSALYTLLNNTSAPQTICPPAPPPLNNTPSPSALPSTYLSPSSSPPWSSASPPSSYFDESQQNARRLPTPPYLLDPPAAYAIVPISTAYGGGMVYGAPQHIVQTQVMQQWGWPAPASGKVVVQQQQHQQQTQVGFAQVLQPQQVVQAGHQHVLQAGMENQRWRQEQLGNMGLSMLL